MNTGTAALAVTGGYLLGRFHKARWAFALAGAAAGRRMRKGDGGGLLKSGELGRLTEGLRGELAAAGKAAALAASARQIDAVSDRLAEQTKALRAGSGDADDASGEDDSGREAGEEPDAESHEESDEESDEDSGERSGGGRSGAGGDAGSGGTGKRSRGSATKAAAKKPAKKPAAAGAGRRKTSGTRPAGAGATRKKTTGRGQTRGRASREDTGTARSGGRGKER